MAEVLVQNMRDPNQQITVVVTIKQAIVPEASPMDPKWILEASTYELDEDGDPIDPVKMYLSNNDNLTDDINDLITELCKDVNWNYSADTDPPRVVGTWPLDGAQAVEVTTDILINLVEEPPSSGIDLSSIRVKVKGFDLTDQLDIKGDFRSCSVLVTPGTKFKSALKKVSQ
jgi:hypothetical protein